ncbi:MAG: sugar transferase, partial [Acidobacteriota bacterium]
MLKEREAVVKTAHLVVDGIVVCAAYLLAIVLRRELGPALSGSWISPLSHVIPASNVSTGQYVAFMVVAVFLWCWMLYASGMYRSMRVLSYRRVLWTICRAGFMTFFAFGATLFLFKATSISRLFLVLFAGLSSLFIVAEKTAVFLALHRLRRRGRDYRRILIVGTGRRAADFIRRTRNHPEWGLQILGAIDDEPCRGIKKVDSVNIIGSLEDIPRILHTDAVDEVFFIVPRSRLSHIEDAIHGCETEGVGTVIPVDLFDMKIARSEVSDIDGMPLLRFSTTRISEWQLFVKRLIDIVFSGLVLVFLLPFLPIMVMLIKM